MAFNIGTIQRQLSTLIEEFKRSRNTWEEINSHAFPTANKLSNAIIQLRYVDETEYWHPLLIMEFPNITQKFELKMQVIVKRHNDQLLDLVEKMGKQYNKMQNQYRDLCGICRQTKGVHGEEFLYKQAIYKTCSLDSFRNRMRAILDMYSREVETKKSLVSNEKGFLSIKSRDEGMVLLSMWINQPGLIISTLQEWEDICTTEMN
ncbi:unnamed protein product [Rhizopus stolonifer]